MEKDAPGATTPPEKPYGGFSRPPLRPPDEPRFYVMFIKATLLALVGLGLVVVGGAWALFALATGSPRNALSPAILALVGVGCLLGGIARIKSIRRREIEWYRARGEEPPRARNLPPAQ
ncbi:MAG TPA: hypothetical protein VG389_11250 [Myxococcota bacterium]|jgi:hypothetical protein|nr:hypothetical protein [Myxococcota bacterium]